LKETSAGLTSTSDSDIISADKRFLNILSLLKNSHRHSRKQQLPILKPALIEQKSPLQYWHPYCLMTLDVMNLNL